MDNQAAVEINTPSESSVGAESTTSSRAVSNIGVLDEFQNELILFWRRLPNKAFFFTLLAAWLALFQWRGNSILGYIHTSSLFGWMYEAYNTPNSASDDKIGNLIPFLVLGLFWWKRRELLELPLKIWIPGLAIVLLGMAFHVVGYMIQEPRVSIIGMFTGIYGLMGLAWGWRWLKGSFFPFFLFIFSIPLGNHSDIITTRLQLLVCWLVEAISHNLLGIGVIRAGTQLYDPSGAYQYEVAAACSGIRSLFSIFLLATAYGFLNFRALWKRVFFMMLAFPFSVLGNLLRMLCIIFAASLFGQKAGDWVHENLIVSLLPYVPTIIGLLWIGSWMEKLEKRKKTEEPKP